MMTLDGQYTIEKIRLGSIQKLCHDFSTNFVLSLHSNLTQISFCVKGHKLIDRILPLFTVTALKIFQSLENSPNN